jgi:hypothetical protein
MRLAVTAECCRRSCASALAVAVLAGAGYAAAGRENSVKSIKSFVDALRPDQVSALVVDQGLGAAGLTEAQFLLLEAVADLVRFPDPSLPKPREVLAAATAQATVSADFLAGLVFRDREGRFVGMAVPEVPSAEGPTAWGNGATEAFLRQLESQTQGPDRDFARLAVRLAGAVVRAGAPAEIENEWSVGDFLSRVQVPVSDLSPGMAKYLGELAPACFPAASRVDLLPLIRLVVDTHESRRAPTRDVPGEWVEYSYRLCPCCW